MSWFSIDIHCPHCGVYEESYIIPRVDKDKPVGCPACGKEVDVRFPAPAILNASYPDGTKRKGWAELKEAARLKKEKANLPGGSDIRKDIDREIKRMNGGKLLT